MSHEPDEREALLARVYARDADFEEVPHYADPDGGESVWLRPSEWALLDYDQRHSRGTPTNAPPSSASSRHAPSSSAPSSSAPSSSTAFATTRLRRVLRMRWLRLRRSIHRVHRWPRAAVFGTGVGVGALLLGNVLIGSAPIVDDHSVPAESGSRTEAASASAAVSDPSPSDERAADGAVDADDRTFLVFDPATGYVDEDTAAGIRAIHRVFATDLYPVVDDSEDFTSTFVAGSVRQVFADLYPGAGLSVYAARSADAAFCLVVVKVHDDHPVYTCASEGRIATVGLQLMTTVRRPASGVLVLPEPTRGEYDGPSMLPLLVRWETDGSFASSIVE